MASCTTVPSAGILSRDSDGERQKAHFDPANGDRAPSVGQDRRLPATKLTPSRTTLQEASSLSSSRQAWSGNGAGRAVAGSTVFQARHLKQRSHCTARGQLACFRQWNVVSPCSRPRAQHISDGRTSSSARRSPPSCRRPHAAHFRDRPRLIAASTLYKSPSCSPWTSALKQRALRVDPDRFAIRPAEGREQQIALERPVGVRRAVMLPTEGADVSSRRRVSHA